jgi:hypothetical protein
MNNNSKAPISRDTLRAVCTKIGYQFPKVGEARLMLAIVEGAINDLKNSHVMRRKVLCINEVRERAARYLSGSVYHAALCGVDPDWIRRVLGDAGINYTPNPEHGQR